MLINGLRKMISTEAYDDELFRKNVESEVLNRVLNSTEEGSSVKTVSGDWEPMFLQDDDGHYKQVGYAYTARVTWASKRPNPDETKMQTIGRND